MHSESTAHERKGASIRDASLCKSKGKCALYLLLGFLVGNWNGKLPKNSIVLLLEFLASVQTKPSYESMNHAKLHALIWWPNKEGHYFLNLRYSKILDMQNQWSHIVLHWINLNVYSVQLPNRLSALIPIKSGTKLDVRTYHTPWSHSTCALHLGSCMPHLESHQLQSFFCLLLTLSCLGHILVLFSIQSVPFYSNYPKIEWKCH